MSTLTASHGLTLSSTGLKLIKAYEGFRPVDRTLVSGHRVVGFGHRLFDDEPVQVTKAEAEDLLKSDLKAFEDMINENVHAPLSQGQFDALVSFSYNIGPKAFLASDTLRALNNGRPLDAANSLDVWRKSTVAGKTYVIDALMRRRTAEKALFLRLDSSPRPASGVDLPPIKDETATSEMIEDEFPIFSKEESSGIVDKTPYETQDAPLSRDDVDQDDIYVLSEVVNESDIAKFEEASETEVEETRKDESPNEALDDAKNLALSSKKEAALEIDPEAIDDTSDPQEKAVDALPANRSVIAEAAADISGRLDALIDKVREEEPSEPQDWPEALIQADDTDIDPENVTNPDDLEATPIEPISEDTLVGFPNQQTEEDEPIIMDDNVTITRVPSKAELEANIFATVQDDDNEIENGIVIDNLREDDAMRYNSDSASRYIERYAPSDEDDNKKSNLGFWIIMLTGFILLGASLAAGFRGAKSLLGEAGPLLILSGLLIGGVMILGAAYYAVRRAFR